MITLALLLRLLFFETCPDLIYLSVVRSADLGFDGTSSTRVYWSRRSPNAIYRTIDSRPIRVSDRIVHAPCRW